MLKNKKIIKELQKSYYFHNQIDIDSILAIYNSLLNIIKGLSQFRALELAIYIVQNKYDAYQSVLNYKRISKSINDLNKWSIEKHKRFVDEINKAKECDVNVKNR